MVFINFDNSFLYWGDPLYMTFLTEGAHLSNSSLQLLKVDNGTIIRNGPKFFLNSIKKQMREIV